MINPSESSVLLNEATVLITGSAGFIGTHLSEYYLKQGFNVIGLDNYITGSQANTEYLRLKYIKQFFFIYFDVSQTWQAITNQISEHLNTAKSTHYNSTTASPIKYVFHLASPASVISYQKFPLETLKANSLGLQNALNFADSYNARLIFTSTSEIYGSPLISPQQESHWGNVNSYGARSCYDEAKRFGEALIYSSNLVNSTQHGLVRIFNTYGPHMTSHDDRVPNTFIFSALSNKELTVFGSGQQTRSFCYIDDLITGLTAYADSKLTIPINLGSDIELSILTLAETVLNITKKITPTESKIAFRPLPQDDPPQRCPDLTLAKKHLHYNVKTSLAEGLTKMIEWRNYTICKK